MPSRRQGVDFPLLVNSARLGTTRVINDTFVVRGRGGGGGGDDDDQDDIPIDVLVRRLGTDPTLVGRPRFCLGGGLFTCLPLGEVRPYNLYMRTVCGKTTLCLPAFSLRDMSARVKAEAAVRVAELADARARGKAAFLSTISHELRNPLNAVVGMTQVCVLVREWRCVLVSPMGKCEYVYALLPHLIIVIILKQKASHTCFIAPPPPPQIVENMDIGDEVRAAVGNIVTATRTVLGILHQLLDYGKVCGEEGGLDLFPPPPPFFSSYREKKKKSKCTFEFLALLN